MLSLSLMQMSASGLVTASHRGVTLGGPWLDPNTNFTIQALGGLSAHDWLHGIIPWWNPYTGVGMPLAGEMQTISLFLPFVLLLHFTNGAILLKIALQMVAGLATYALLRQLGLGRFAAFAGAVLYEFNGALAWFAHAPIAPIPFLPLLLLGIERALACAEQARRGGWVLIGVALAYSLYAGFPETAFLDGLLVLVWILYRIVVVRAGARLSFAIKVAIGGIAGLLLAAPIVLPFYEYLGLSPMGRAFAVDSGLPKMGLAGLLMPYIFGPISAFNSTDITGKLGSFWGAGGGYLNVTVLFLAVLSLFTGKRVRSLRLVLLVWLIIFIGRAVGVRQVGYLFTFIPLMKMIAVFRYCIPSCAMAAAILGAYALDDWYRGETGRFKPVLVSGIVSFALALFAVGLASDLITRLLHSLHGKHYPLWLWGSVAWASLFTIGIGVLCSHRPNTRAAIAVAALIVTNVVGLFAIPPLAGPRHEKLDLGLVTFLQQHLGLQRFYTLGPLSPNYGGYFRIASINHNLNPIPSDWTRYIQSSLDPINDPSLFIGWRPGPVSDREEALRANLTGFEKTAVKYVLVHAGTNPFIDTAIVPTKVGQNLPRLLQAGQSFQGVLPLEMGRNGSLATVGVTIGLYGGPATGQLKAEICVAEACTSGIRSLTEARDQRNFEINLDTPLQVKGGDTLRYRFTHIEADEPEPRNYFLFLWLYPKRGTDTGSSTVSAAGQADYTPGIKLIYRLGSARPKLAYRGNIADVLALPHPAPYFETYGGPCEISAETRERVRASCKRPAVLLRHELFYPGWRAVVNGRKSPVTRSASIFQTVHLPGGESNVSFSYQPSHIAWAYTAAIVGLLLLLSGVGGISVPFFRNLH
jgi:hypothetical protein